MQVKREAMEALPMCIILIKAAIMPGGTVHPIREVITAMHGRMIIIRIIVFPTRGQQR